ncbi:hypothetical protein [Deinococcus aerolatus]|nr:hypothetical protein [Deinococcus aerolatus]
MATATTIRGGGSPASALFDLLDNGSRAAPDSVREVLAFAQQALGPTFDLPARLQRAAAELDAAVQRADQVQLHVLDHHALFLAHQTVARITRHVLDDVEWQALVRGGGDAVAEPNPPYEALLRHAGVLEAAALLTRESLALAGRAFGAAVSHGPEGTYAIPEATLMERDLEHDTVADLDLRLALVLLGEEVPMTPDRLLEWCRAHRPGVLGYGQQVAQALWGMGEGLVPCCERVSALLRETLRASGAVMLSLDTPTTPTPRCAVSGLAVQLVLQSLSDKEFQAGLKAGWVVTS